MPKYIIIRKITIINKHIFNIFYTFSKPTTQISKKKNQKRDLNALNALNATVSSFLNATVRSSKPAVRSFSRI